MIFFVFPRTQTFFVSDKATDIFFNCQLVHIEVFPDDCRKISPDFLHDPNDFPSYRKLETRCFDNVFEHFQAARVTEILFSNRSRLCLNHIPIPAIFKDRLDIHLKTIRTVKLFITIRVLEIVEKLVDRVKR